MSTPDVVTLVPHTHWDREWYEPFQRFRLRLVRLLDEVLDRAETDPGFCFTVDGQMAAIEDYLEVRPENHDRVAALVAAGRLAVGPWQILLDEFLCSGENIVRNLELGHRGAAALGAVMPVGYLPDMFGHCAQMPQILAGAGLEHACVWRGVPSDVGSHAFAWVAPDGTAVRTEYLPGGYGNGADLFIVPERLASTAEAYRDAALPWFGDGPVLAMFGTDHSAPLPGLMDLVRKLESDAAPVRLDVRTLTDYVAGRDPTTAGLHRVEGELRSHARANILPGVISVRGHLKQAMARAERQVERYAEPLAALWSSQDYTGFLEMAWHRLVSASCHDSVTGCGVDETATQVAARLAEADQLGQAVRDQVLGELAAHVPASGYVVANPTPATRTGLVELTMPVDADHVRTVGGDTTAVQELDRRPTLLAEETRHRDDVPAVLGWIHGRELYGQQIESLEVEPGTLVFHVTPTPTNPDFDPHHLRARVHEALAGGPEMWTVRIVAAPRRAVLAEVTVPPTGVVALVPSADGPAGTEADRAEAVRGVEAIGDGLRNTHVAVTAGPDGCLTVRGEDGTTLTGLGRLVDGGDRGDSYNYGRPADDHLVDRPVAVAVEVLEEGPLRAALAVDRTYRWPTELAEDDPDRRSDTTVDVPVRTRVELRAGEPFVRLAVSFRNPANDHRLRLHLPLPDPTEHSYAEGQFAVTRRGLTNEGGFGEDPAPTFPASAFVSAGAAHVLLDQVTEYEVVDRGSELALTLLRSIGMLSVNAHPARAEPAGPQLPVPRAQRLGDLVTCRLAVLPRSGDWEAAGVTAQAERFRHGLATLPGTGDPCAPGPTPLAGLEVTGAGVTVSSIRPRGEALEVRLLAATSRPTTATLTGAFGTWTPVDLRGRPLAGTEPTTGGQTRIALSPWEISTVRLDR